MDKKKIHTTIIITKDMSLYPYVFDEQGNVKSRAEIIKGIVHAGDYIIDLALRKHVISEAELNQAIKLELNEVKNDK